MKRDLAFIILHAQTNELLREDNKVTSFMRGGEVAGVLNVTMSALPTGWVAVGILYEKGPPPPSGPAEQAQRQDSEAPARKRPRHRAG